MREYSRMGGGTEAVCYRGRWSSKPGNQGSGRESCTGPHGRWSPTQRQGCQPADLRENRQHTLRMAVMLEYQWLKSTVPANYIHLDKQKK